MLNIVKMTILPKYIKNAYNSIIKKKKKPTIFKWAKDNSTTTKSNLI